MDLSRRRPDETFAFAAFLLVVLTVPAHLWVAGMDLPLGGPNIVVASLAILGACCYALLRCVGAGSYANFKQPFVTVTPVLATASVLVLWAVVVYLATDTFSHRRVGQMIVGVGMLFTVFCCTTSPRRAQALVFAIVLATFVSTIFGFGSVFYGDPFLTIWLRLADDVSTIQFGDILTNKRIAGLSSDSITFSYQLAIALPLVYALLLYGIQGGRRSRMLADAVGCVLFLVLSTAMIVNASRSMILGVLIGLVAVSAIYLRGRKSVLRLVVVVCLAAGWNAVLFSPTLGVDTMVFPDEPYIAVSDLAELENAPTGSFEWKLGRAYAALLLSDRRLAANVRMFRLMDDSTRPRPHMFTAAIRYSLDYPFGTGRYYPSEAHLDAGLDEKTRRKVLTSGPHNQFLVVLVYYGYPGLILLIVFYLQMLRPLWPAFLRSMAPSTELPVFLVPGVIGAMIAYGTNSLLHNAGPFVGDWYHFILVGLVFALPKVGGSSDRTGS